jgi:hypothetical protein
MQLPTSGYAQTRPPLVYRLRLDRKEKELTRAEASTNVAVLTVDIHAIRDRDYRNLTLNSSSSSRRLALTLIVSPGCL